jgi:hypothetical protein
MRRLPLLVTIASLCAPVTAAHAWTEPPADDPGRLARFLPLARAAWPGSPCTGRETVHLGANVVLAEYAPVVAGPDKDLVGMAAPATCEAWLASGLTAFDFCVTLVHELGHLAGRGHTHVVGDVMNGDGAPDYEPCDEAVREPLGVMIDGEVRDQLPAPRDSWRITCTAVRTPDGRCVARRGRSMRRFIVHATADSLTVMGDG